MVENLQSGRNILLKSSLRKCITTLLVALTTAASAQTKGKPDLIESDSPFTPGAMVEVKAGRLFPNENNKIESGELNGVRYSFFTQMGVDSLPVRATTLPKFQGVIS
jgi:hypothetical protein